MLLCPRCDARLARTATPAGFHWSCPSCGGRTSTLPVLRKRADEATLNRLWQDARADGPAGCRCPSCLRPMRAVSFTAGDEPVTLDVCRRCLLFWFDRAEIERLPAPSQPPPLSPQAQTAARALELESSERVPARARPDQPHEPWKILLGLFGMPVEIDGHDVVVHTPWLTRGLVAAVVLASVAAFASPERAFELFAFQTSLDLPRVLLTSLTYFFLHGTWTHLLGNMYFLWTFGDNVEEFLGRARYALLLVLSTVVSAAAHGLFEDDLGLIGASGGIAGVVTFYALEFPHIRIGQFILWLRLFQSSFWLTFSARTGLLLFFAFQVIGILLGHSTVSYAGHLGGMATGFVFWWLGRARAPRLAPT